MSFLNTIRGLGRSSKKTKKEYDQGVYTGSTLPRRLQLPVKLSPMKPRQLQILFAPLSPKRSKMRLRLPQRDAETPLFLCEPFVKTSLVKGLFKTIVQLPKYVDYGEWLSLNMFEMFNHLNQFYGIIAEYVTAAEFPTMNAGPNTNYLWIDTAGQPTNLPAGQYIEYVLAWALNKINDQLVFPTKNGGAFPPNFVKDCKNLARQMFRIFAHVYYNHFERLLHLSLEAHWNSFFAHFVSFCREFALVDRKEMAPLAALIEVMELQGKIV